ncbi:MAG: cyclic nucleotide-binding domain-containing protein [Actinobacteria bacterium]|nr:MAG: cyclic nucleotide-binding domain-containing protein [Actinomycetota bacterium]TML49780.1 MAG: cyclic nucleotide-binding domain-containing protein [Actinomycetota bacterium]TMM30210.1 MAG: cyclic nucleotide-binding domain-containing protein [Actinomycetota bacterium]
MRLGRDQKTELIRQVPLFSRCSRAELKEIAKLADEIDLRQGKEMTREGAPGREFFVLLDGTADVRKKGRKINTLGAGDFFGEISLVSRQPRTATVTATSPVRALVVTDYSFRHLLDESPQIKTKVMEAMAERLAPETL